MSPNQNEAIHTFGRWVAACLVTMLLSIPAAQAVSVELIQYQGRRVLLVRDEPASADFPRGRAIAEGDAARFERVLRQSQPVSEVLLDSRGGLVIEGLAMGRAIRRAGLSTRIPKGARCASSCADIFMGGIARRVDEGGRYGIHMATSVSSDEAVDRTLARILHAYGTTPGQPDREAIKAVIQRIEQSAAREAANWGAYVLEMGGSPRIVDLGTKSKASEMNYLSRPEMIDLNVINVDN